MPTAIQMYGIETAIREGRTATIMWPTAATLTTAGITTERRIGIGPIVIWREPITDIPK